MSHPSPAPAWIAGSAELPQDLRGAVVTIGNFDGVHRGHRTLVDRAVDLAAELGTCALAYTFDPAPRDVLRPDNPVARIQTLAHRVRDLRAAGLRQVVVEPFTLALAATTPEQFAHRVLRDRLGAAAVVVGHDFRFGKGRTGGFSELREALSVPVEQLPALADGEAPVSSSRIRAALQAGDVAGAALLLGRPHRLGGRVVVGDRRGRKLGFPTANVVHGGGLLPAFGVYAVRLALSDEEGGATWLPGVANVGHRPTFKPGKAAIEVHLFDVDLDLYGAAVEVAFVARIRDEQSFPSIDALVAQIGRDCTAARLLL